MPLKFWDEAFATAVFLINRLPTMVLHGLSPSATIFKTKPDYSFLKIFNCQCFPYLRPDNSHKLSYRSIPCTFLGYSPSHKGYRCFSSEGRVYISRNVIFNESFFPYSQSSFLSLSKSPSSILLPAPGSMLPETTSSTTSHELSMASAPISSTPTSPSPGPLVEVTHDSLHASPSPPVTRNDHLMVTRGKSGIFKPKVYVSESTAGYDNSEPPNVKEALKFSHWRKAMQEEYDALQKNET